MSRRTPSPLSTPMISRLSEFDSQCGPICGPIFTNRKDSKYLVWQVYSLNYHARHSCSAKPLTQKPIKRTALGSWLKGKAPHILDTVGDLLPDQGGLGSLKRILDKDDVMSPRYKVQLSSCSNCSPLPLTPPRFCLFMSQIRRC